MTTHKSSPSSFTNHGRKDVIRKLWCKPLIEMLYKQVKKKLIYIGLPDIEALDIIEWIEYLDKVIAFQCPVYNSEKVDVSRLDDILNTLELQQKIRSGIVYEGWMEDIIMGGVSVRGQIYSQSDFLKIYNLDFCSNINVPRIIITPKGKKKEIIYKTDVIDKLIAYEDIVAKQGKGSRFIMFVTVNSNTFTEDLSVIRDVTIKKYLKKLETIRKPEVKAIRQMKAYCFFKLREIFQKHNFHIEFLPPVFYQGSGYYPDKGPSKMINHRMMTFTILGTKSPGLEKIHQQDSDKFLNEKFIFATDKELSCLKEDNFIIEKDFEPNIVQLVKSSHTYSNYWVQ